MKRKVTVEGEGLRFSAAHMTTIGDKAEPLHGHNYRVTVSLEGDLTANSWVFDFVALRRLARRLCAELDHRFLLQRESRVLQAQEHGDEWEITIAGRRYVIPKADVVALPIDNVTAERLAEWLSGRLKDELRATGAKNLTSISVGVEEAPGQAAWHSEEFGQLPGYGRT